MIRLKVTNTGMSYWKLLTVLADRVEDETVVAVLSQMANDRWVIKDPKEKGKLTNRTFGTPNEAKKWMTDNYGKVVA